MLQLAQRSPIYYGWINVVFASIAMSATLPGRTHGLGLITKPLIEDVGATETVFAQLNFASTLIGALFALPTGYFVDRVGVRRCGTLIVLLLACTVLTMAGVESIAMLFVWLTLTRGLGQSALSVVSMAMIGKWFRGRVGMAMGLYAVLLTFGFIGSILGMGALIDAWGWRDAWRTLGWSLLATVLPLWLFVRDSPEACGIAPDPEASEPTDHKLDAPRDFHWHEALSTSAFWVVALGTSAFNMVWSAITLFNESILSELKFSQANAVEMMAFLTGMGLLTNIAIGKFATRERSGKLLGLGLLCLAFALAFFPSISSMTHLRVYGAAMGFVGGLVTVVHFAIWGQLFGRLELGRIQGAAQVVSVLASATGPLVMAQVGASSASYMPCFYGFSVVVAIVGVAALWVRIPHPVDSRIETAAH